MSLNLSVVADKCEFTNEFSDGIILPANSSVALTKTNMTLPIVVQNILKSPFVNPANYNDVGFFVNIDGIRKGITWQNFFDAFREYDNSVLEPNITIADFYSGKYQFFTNNKILFKTLVHNATRDSDKPSVSWVLSRAINNAFNFYSCRECSNFTSQSINIGQPNLQGNSLIGRNNHNYNNSLLYSVIQDEIGLNIFYDPYKLYAEGNGLPTATTVQNNACHEFNNVVGSLTGTGNGNAIAVSRGSYEVDINGGYIRCQPNHIGGSMSWGFNLSSSGSLSSTIAPDGATAIKKVIHVGISFDTNNRLTILDGISQVPVYNGNVVADIPFNHIVDDFQTRTYNNNADYFFIQILKNIEGNYIFNIYQGTDNTPLDNTNVFLIYSCKTQIKHATVIPTEVFTSSANANVFNDIAHTQASVDTLIQQDLSSRYNYGIRNTFTIETNFSTNNQVNITNFFNALGLQNFNKTHTLNADPLLTEWQNNSKVTYEGNCLNKTIRWKTNFKDGDNRNTNINYYWVGKIRPKDFYVYKSIGETAAGVALNSAWVVNDETSLSNLPKELNVFINNLDLKSYQGSYHSLTSTQTQVGQTRLVGTIPLDFEENNPTNAFLDIYYETFNPYYRPINNPEPFKINQLQVEISYKNPNTDKRETIDEVDGLLRCEFNIRKMTPTKGNNIINPLI